MRRNEATEPQKPVETQETEFGRFTAAREDSQQRKRSCAYCEVNTTDTV